MLLPLFKVAQDTALGVAIRSSLWLFPVIEAFHLLALALIGGAVLVVDLRLAGFILKDHPTSRLARDAQPWLIGSLAVMLLSGLMLWTSEAVKCYYNLAFWLKMGFLALAMAFTFTVRQRVAAADGRVQPIWMRTVAFVSVTLWSGVGLMGRGIGFY
jgi:Family of unknown function (DUF6644)